MTLLFLDLTVHVHLLLQVADFLDGELYSANLKNISFLNFVVLLIKVKRLLYAQNLHVIFATYNFLVVNLQTTNDKVHRFLELSILLDVVEVRLMVLVRRIFQVESAVVPVDNFEHGHVFWLFLYGIDLILEATLVIICVE